MKTSQPLRIDHPRYGSFGTARTQHSRLWFVNNQTLTEDILGYLAKYQEKYNVQLYAFVIQGSHYHLTARFPNSNRAKFYRDFNARIVEAVKRNVEEYDGGHLFERRYAEQALPEKEDYKHQFFYCALQPVLAGLTQRIGQYPGYNSVWHAMRGIDRRCRVIDWSGYKEAKRRGHKPIVQDFTTYYDLKFSRLPGEEEKSQKQYHAELLNELERRRLAEVRKLLKDGHTFMTTEQLKRVRPGSYPVAPKTSKRNSYRPLMLTKSAEARQLYLEFYFSTLVAYKAASKRFLAGDLTVEFPPYTYPPPRLVPQPA